MTLEAAPTGMLLVNTQGRIELMNTQLEKLFGYERHELIGQPVEILVPESVRHHHAQLRSDFNRAPSTRAMGAGRDLFGMAKDGTEVPIEIGLNPLRTGFGMFVLSSIVDLTERKRAAQRLRDSLHEKELLLKEVHHRVKNNLQVVSSLLSLQAHHVSDPRLRAALAQSQARVHSLALVHEQLYQSPELSRVRFAEYVRELVKHLMRGHSGNHRVECHVEDSPTQMSMDACILCGLVVNELLTNSLKHAFPDGRPGSIEVTMHAHPQGWELCVRDDGIGLPAAVDPHRARSLGLDLVATLAKRLKADLRVTCDGGTATTLTFAPW